MTRAHLEPGELENAVLTQEIQEELGVIGDTIRSTDWTAYFRMDPGNLFERRGYLYGKQDGTWDIGIMQRYQPDEPLQLMARAEAVALDVLPAALRKAVSIARGSTAYCPHWLDRARAASSPWWITCPATKPDASGIITSAAAQQARDTGTVYYVYTVTGLVSALNSPPGNGRFYSVTPEGDWSLHSGALTRPLTAPPALQGEQALATRSRPSVAAQQATGRRR